MNYFELFGLPVGFVVDKSELARKYFELQKKYHPDFYTQETEHAQSQALELSSEVNKALKVLRNPDETIKYLLQLKGFLEEDEKYQLPPDFLMEMMELNEGLDGDTATQIAGLEKELYAGVEPILNSYRENSSPDAGLLKVKEYYYKKKYLQRILDRIAG